MNEAKTIVAVVPTLNLGGSEKSLNHFLNAMGVFPQVEIHLLVLAKGTHETKLLNSKAHVKFLEAKRTLNPFLWLKLIFLFRKIKPDLTVGWSTHPAIILLLLKPFIPGHIYISERSSTLHYYKKYVHSFRKYELILQKKLYPKADGIIFNSTQNLRMYRLFFKKKCPPLFFLPNCSTIFFDRANSSQQESLDFYDQFGLDPSSFKILVIGRVFFEKGYDVLFKALSAVEISKLQLIIVGDGSDKNFYKKIAEEVGIDNKVFWVGKQKDTSIFYKFCDVYIQPSRYEGFPNGLLEAISFGIPVISSDCYTGPTELLDRGRLGLLFRNEDFKDLQEKLCLLYHNYSNYQLLSLKAQKEIFLKYNKDAVYQKYQNFICQTLGLKTQNYDG